MTTHLLTALLVTAAPVFAHEQPTHVNITAQALQYLVSTNARPNLLQLYSQLTDGAWNEDALFPGYPGYLGRFYFHFLPTLNNLGQSATCNSVEWGVFGSTCTARTVLPLIGSTSEHSDFSKLQTQAVGEGSHSLRQVLSILIILLAARLGIETLALIFIHTHGEEGYLYYLKYPYFIGSIIVILAAMDFLRDGSTRSGRILQVSIGAYWLLKFAMSPLLGIFSLIPQCSSHMADQSRS